jgi:ABC-type dipeptide transport system, periplasmic component
MHDALVKPMPGNHLTPSLAESWTVSSDQKTYEFKLREGLKFHNGDPFTSEDVKFSFLRTKGAGAKVLRKKSGTSSPSIRTGCASSCTSPIPTS